MFKARRPDVVTRHAITTSVIDIGAADRALGRHYALVHVAGVFGEAFANPVEPERPQHA
jgi:hypothetical protein